MVLDVNYGMVVVTTGPRTGVSIHAHPATFEGQVGHHGPIAFYDHDSFLVTSAVEFVLPALQEGSVAVAVLAGHHQGAVERQLSLAGIDVSVARARGNFVTVDSEQLAQTLVVGGQVDVERFEAMTRELFQAAAGRPGVIRICGDLATVLWDVGEVEAVLTLEHLWNHIRDAPAFELLCLYATSVIADATPEAFSAACALHTTIDPIESHPRLVASDISRALVLLDAQEQSRRRDHETIDRVVREAHEQQEQFSDGLASRDVIGQAKGILMVRERVDADAAFAMLADASCRSHRKLHVVAQALVDQQLRRN